MSLLPATSRRGAAVTLLATATLLLAATVAWAAGELTQKPEAAGCVSNLGVGGCGTGKALVGATGVATSPDGRNVYVASAESDAIAVFDRDRTTGELTQKQGLAGCTSETGSDGACEDGRGLNGASRVAISPDGRSVYVTSVSSALAILDRDPATGELSQLDDPRGCISTLGSGGACTPGRGIGAAVGVAVSPDGKTVYVASVASAAVAIFERAPAGGLAQPDGTAGCVSDGGRDGCADGDAMGAAFDVVVSPDGRSVYVAIPDRGSVAVFDRDRDGALTPRPGPVLCDLGCRAGARPEFPVALATSADGESVYVASGGPLPDGGGAISILDRDQVSGALTRKPGAAGCISEDGSGGACADGTAIVDPFDIAVGSGGADVYVAGRTSDAVAVFDRDRATGTLTQKPAAPCISETGTGGECGDGTALDGAVGISLSPDGGNLYAAAPGSTAVAILDRAGAAPVPPPTPVPTPTPTPAPPPRPEGDIVAPTVSRFGISPARFRARRRGRARFRFTLSEPATVRIRVERAFAGRGVGRLTQRDRPAGRNTLAFSGRLRGRTLAPGRYRATISAVDRAGNRSAERRTGFTIRRP